ncbi:uncharacterized protein LOC26526222 [Drosophila erecta]|uniref:BPTI/Kunitz inhibitor domain-containing protein n=1 Tax=Drosophila erecta TaxID=7220 RepID=A0A0Q5T2F6_DROER|nr:uncharacterized protein LOC26527046 [Drosophila erecta]XP_015015473.1 uncharacterized protein LOC26526222 [Drosophila erecta]KQS24651.1 uncharacterized protein Dere_GG27222 [Drosophila erecta]KQS70055.1 uncharacterized protein Dere_GG26398 [Drosophila erecta]
MKFVALLSLMTIAIGLAQGQRDVKCFMEPLPQGFCSRQIVGYTYSRVRTSCVNYEALGCAVAGNFFTDKKVCEARCKPVLTFRNNPFSYYVEGAFDQATKMLRRLLG